MVVATIETTDFLTCAQAAEVIGDVSADSLRRYCANAREGKTPAIQAMQVGRDWLIHRDEVARYKTERRDRGRPPKDAN